MQRRTLIQAAAAACAGGLANAARAEMLDYPKAGATIRYVVPFPPGGLTDVMARLVGQKLAERWNVTVVVENKPGGGGQIGADAVAKAAPDGNTILAVTLTHAANVTLYEGRSPFDLRRDLLPVALLAGSPMLIVVPVKSPIKDINDLVSTARARPLNAGSSGNGTPPHLTLALFNDLMKTQVQHVPYKGGAPSMTDLIGGQLDVVFSNLPESIVHVQAGKLRALALCSKERHALLPDVPTTAEAGLAALQVENWTAIMAPAGMPEAAVDKLGNEVVKIMNTHELEDRARAQGFRVDAKPAAPFARFLDDETKRWAAVIRSAGIKPD